MARRKTGQPPTALQGGNRGAGILAADPAGHPYAIPFGEVPASFGTGDVVGPTGATDNAIARYDTTTGKLLQDSIPLVQDDGRISLVTDPTSAQDAATKAYVDAAGGGSGAAISATAVGSEPGTPAAGDVDLYTNGFGLARYSGAAWVPWGPLYPLTDPALAAPTTWVNQGGARVVTTNGGIFLRAPKNSGNSVRARVKTAPATPYTITMGALFTVMGGGSAQNAGLLFRNSVSGKLVTFGPNFSASTGLVVFTWTDATTFSATVVSGFDVRGGILFLRIADDGTNRIYSVSVDGQNFIQIFSEPRTTFLTADQVGFWANDSDNRTDVGVTVLSWKET